MTNWRIRAYQHGDEDGIASLFESVYRKPLNRARWQWKLHTLSTPAKNEWVAVADGRIVGYYAVMPLPFQVNGRMAIIPHTCDVMTHPHFRKSGIFTALSAHANDAWCKTDAPFKIGFPQWERIGSVLAEVGWQRVVRVVWLKCVLRPFAFLARKLGVRRVRSLHHTTPSHRKVDDEINVARVCAAGDEFDALWHALAPRYPISVVRDRAWVQWRHFDVPAATQCVLLARRKGEPCGYLAYRVQHDADKTWAVMVDGFAAPHDHATVRALLHHAQHALSAQSAESLVALVPLRSPLHGELRRAGFWSTRRGYDFSIVPYQSNGVGLNPDDWFLSGAESDVV